MMSYFSSYQIREHWPHMVLSTVAELQCPVLQSGELRGQPGGSCSAPDFLEWLGAVFSGAELYVGAWGAGRALATEGTVPQN